LRIKLQVISDSVTHSVSLSIKPWTYPCSQCASIHVSVCTSMHFNSRARTSVHIYHDRLTCMW